MRIVELVAPTGEGSLWDGLAVSIRGRRYQFGIDRTGHLAFVHREESPTLPDAHGRTLWRTWGFPTPAALRRAARAAYRAALN